MQIIKCSDYNSVKDLITDFSFFFFTDKAITKPWNNNNFRIPLCNTICYPISNPGNESFLLWSPFCECFNALRQTITNSVAFTSTCIRHQSLKMHSKFSFILFDNNDKTWLNGPFLTTNSCITSFYFKQ